MRKLRRWAALLVLVAGCGGEPQPPPERVAVPGVSGIDVAAAECGLARAGLRWRYGGAPRPRRARSGPCAGPYPAGDTVCRQDPRAGSRVPAGAIVELRTREAATPRQRRGCDAPPARGGDDPRAPVLTVAFEYFRTPKVGAGGAACRLLTGEEQARLGRRRRGGCAEALNRALGRRLIAGRETVAQVRSFDAAARTATATVLGMSIRGEPPVIRLRRERGAWRIYDSGL